MHFPSFLFYFLVKDIQKLRGKCKEKKMECAAMTYKGIKVATRILITFHISVYFTCHVRQHINEHLWAPQNAYGLIAKVC